jgi:predicted dehydrogenase
MRVAIVGTGYIAGRHAEALAAMAGEDAPEIVGFLDVAPDAAAQAAQKWGGKPYADIDEMLEDARPQAVWICVPPFAHGAVESACLRKGVALYIEKPIGTDTDGPQAIADEIARSDSLVNVGYYWRCIEAMPRLKALLDETPPRLVRAAWHGLTPPAPWWGVQEKSGGQMVEQATHLVDTMRWLLGEATVSYATARHTDRPEFPDLDVATVTAAALEFGEVPALISATCVLGNTTDANIEFYCDGRKITLGRAELTIETPDDKAVEELGSDPLVLADEAFLKAVRTGDASLLPCPYDDALRTQQLCVDIQTQSGQAGMEAAV